MLFILASDYERSPRARDSSVSMSTLCWLGPNVVASPDISSSSTASPFGGRVNFLFEPYYSIIECCDALYLGLAIEFICSEKHWDSRLKRLLPKPELPQAESKASSLCFSDSFCIYFSFIYYSSAS